jgi:hypothetical protein
MSGVRDVRQAVLTGSSHKPRKIKSAEKARESYAYR